MTPTDDVTVLVPVDISGSYSLPVPVLELLSSVHVVVLGYYPVPSQAAPAQIKHQHEASARRQLEAVANHLSNHADAVTDILVFTHDRDESVDRIADTYDVDAILTPGEGASINRLLVPLRGDSNIENILSLVTALLNATNASATLFHSVDASDSDGHGEGILEAAVDNLAGRGIDRSRIDKQLSTDDDTVSDILTAEDGYDVLVIGESEPSLRDRILGRVPSRLLSNTPKPVFVVRDTNGTTTDS
ncbi:hypothetical protein C475_22044 [Halosimplex carlsbadense 2-9-1]|uniref:UspA domain-containing protein n=1 Tax=Halosimplex carlsbadense 2-9-1 TaxID=797114 RepID=M0CBE4_9EURY|nr:universal stress protein [Halosimplex carlsbadense]ELZ19672.1 hypothetical protein C475_22044 [Halosimplex carlsbadense 2-9-1]